MKVAFLKAPVGGIIGLEMITFVEPLGLECVAGGLEDEGHECRIVDLRIDGFERGLAKARAFEPEVVGLQCNFTTERFRLLRLARRVKQDLPDALLVVGGHDASRDPEWFLHPAIDVVAVGDGEEILPALVTAYERGEDLARVPGLLLNRPGGPVNTGHAPAREEHRRAADARPAPHRRLRRGVLHQLPPAPGAPRDRPRLPLQVQLLLGVEVSREHLPREVARARRPRAAQIQAPNVFITDDIFWMNARRGRELAEAIKASGIRKHYTIQTRSDIITRFPDLIETWRDCGKMTIFLGLEKIDDAGLSSVNKKNTVANNNRAIEILQDLGVGYTPNFIVDPSWEREDFDKLKRWIDEDRGLQQRLLGAHPAARHRPVGRGRGRGRHRRLGAFRHHPLGATHPPAARRVLPRARRPVEARPWTCATPPTAGSRSTSGCSPPWRAGR